MRNLILSGGGIKGIALQSREGSRMEDVGNFRK
jgi:hypothetical protein